MATACLDEPVQLADLMLNGFGNPSGFEVALALARELAAQPHELGHRDRGAAFRADAGDVSGQRVAATHASSVSLPHPLPPMWISGNQPHENRTHSNECHDPASQSADCKCNRVLKCLKGGSEEQNDYQQDDNRRAHHGRHFTTSILPKGDAVIERLSSALAAAGPAGDALDRTCNPIDSRCSGELRDRVA